MHVFVWCTCWYVREGTSAIVKTSSDPEIMNVPEKQNKSHYWQETEFTFTLNIMFFSPSVVITMKHEIWNRMWWWIISGFTSETRAAPTAVNWAHNGRRAQTSGFNVCLCLLTNSFPFFGICRSRRLWAYLKWISNPTGTLILIITFTKC